MLNYLFFFIFFYNISIFFVIYNIIKFIIKFIYYCTFNSDGEKFYRTEDLETVRERWLEKRPGYIDVGRLHIIIVEGK